jgi:hypothetical protein
MLALISRTRRSIAITAAPTIVLLALLLHPAGAVAAAPGLVTGDLAGDAEGAPRTSPGTSTAGLTRSPELPGTGSFLPPPIMTGWPQTMGTVALYSPVGVVLADLEGDGDLEVLAGSTDSRFYVWNHDGTLLSGWPLSVGGRVQSKAAAADLDGDGDLEILVSVTSGQLRAYHHDATPVSGWPQASGISFGFLSPVVYDLDGDGTPEVLIGGGGLVRAWHADGTPVAGFPVAVSGTISGTLAVGDIAGDPAPEILAVTTSPGMLHVLGADGTVVPGWPLSLGLSTSYAAPSIGDLDHDGTREALVVGYNFGTDTSIFALRGDGSAFPGFPITYGSLQTYSCPVIGDIDGDDDLELFNAGKIEPGVYAWDHTGTLLPGWPVDAGANLEGSPIVANFDADGALETVIGDNYFPGLIYGFNPDGTTVADFPIPKPGASLPNSPELADVDGDGDLDMAMTMSTGDVALWDFAIPYDATAIEWGGLFHDNWNTNQHGFVVPTGSTGLQLAGAPATVLRLGDATPNPFNPSTWIPFELDGAATVRLTVHDAGGRLVRTLVDATLGAGRHGARWDGRDASGRPLASGCYWARLTTPTAERTTSMVLVK